MQLNPATENAFNTMTAAGIQLAKVTGRDVVVSCGDITLRIKPDTEDKATFAQLTADIRRENKIACFRDLLMRSFSRIELMRLAVSHRIEFKLDEDAMRELRSINKPSLHAEKFVQCIIAGQSEAALIEVLEKLRPNRRNEILKLGDL